MMNRLLSTVHIDARLQLRNGFYAATLFVLLVYAVGLSQIHAESMRAALVWLIPAMVLQNLVLTSFYFVAGLVLLEKTEGSLAAQTVTPLRIGEYVASKVFTLTVLGVLYNSVLVVLICGFNVALLPLATGIALAASIYTLVGFVAVVRFESINQFILPSALYVAPLMLPIVYVAGWNWPLRYLHPIEPALVLLRAAFEPISGWQIVYTIVYGGVWVILAYVACRRSFQRFVVERGIDEHAGH